MINKFEDVKYHVIVKVLIETEYDQEGIEYGPYSVLPAYGVNEQGEIVYPNPLTGVLIATTEKYEDLEFVRIIDSSIIYAELQIGLYEATVNRKDESNDDDKNDGLFGGLL